MPPIRIALVVSALATATAGCSAAPAPTAANGSTDARATDAAQPAPAAVPARPAAPVTNRHYAGAEGLVRLDYPAALTPTRDFAGRSLMSAGWRLIWDGAPVGPGTGVVSFAQDARPTSGDGVVTEMIRIGTSRDAGVVAQCGTTGALGGSGAPLPNRMLGGHRWTAYRNGDAGMSQQVDAIDLRTVVDGACYAIDRVTYRVAAARPLPATAPPQAVAAARIDAILASVRVGRVR